MDNDFESMVLTYAGANKLLKKELIQSLWSGYGELLRLKLDNKNVILKYINLTKQSSHPKGWNSSISHKRKVNSYKVEMNWYKDYQSSATPKLIASGEHNGMQYLLLEDLLESHFVPKSSINFNEVKMCLSWLAKFHKAHTNTIPKGLWRTGTYWHLETRPDELSALKDSELKSLAPIVDEKLNSSPFKTIVHGDAKLANFLFNKNEVSAVDFQYVGGGVGIKDIIYFLSSVYNEKELFENEQRCLNHYFKELNNKEIEKEYRELYPYAWTDFYRFLKGWDPNHYKVNSYLEHMKNKVIDAVKK